MKKSHIIMAAGIAAVSISAGVVLALGNTAEQESIQETEQIQSDEGTEDIIRLGESGYSMEIPQMVRDRATIQTDGFDDTTIVKISETASLKINEEQEYGYDNPGFLCSISTVTEDEARALRCGDMSGCEIFAEDGNGTCFVLNYPTDVTMIREQHAYTDEELQMYGMLNSWVNDSAAAGFIRCNEGLTAVRFGNTSLDICMARAAFDPDAEYTLSTTQYGPLHPAADGAEEYLDDLLNHSHITYADETAKIPDGEYVVLNFEQDGIRFDFFLADDGKNLVRSVLTLSEEDEFEELYEVSFDKEDVTASDIMQDWYDAAAEAEGLAE